MANLFSFGNLKVGKDTAIFNITSAKNCISEQLGLCNLGAKCYAKKAERLYPSVVLHREFQQEYWERTDAKEFVAMLLAIIKVEQRKNIKYLRVSESGDLKNQNDLDKLSEIADLLKDKLIVYTYTARKDLNFSHKSSNLVINGSGFMIDNNFYIIKNEKELIDKFLCKSSCLNCNLCKVSRGINIGVKIH